jgi:hypothetical protein
MMHRARLQKLLDSHGCDPSKWPEAERHAAERAFASDARAHEALEQARRLDRLIEQSLADRPLDESCDVAACRILARLPRRLPNQRRSLPKAAVFWAWLAPERTVWWPRVAALGFAAVLGIAAGLFSADREAMYDRHDRIAVLDDTDADLNAVLFDTETLAGPSR